MKNALIIMDKLGLSFSKIVVDIAKVLQANDVNVGISDFRNLNISKTPKNIIHFAALGHDILNYAAKLSGKRNIILYLTAEGKCKTENTLKKALNKNATILAVSKYAKSKIEEQGLKCSGVIPHGTDLTVKPDVKWAGFIEEQVKNNTIFLNISENGIRKGLDRLLIIYKIIHHAIPDTYLIIHSNSDGFYKLRSLARSLQLDNFWITDLMTPELALTNQQINALYYLTAKTRGIYLVTSYAEGFGMPVIESFKYGVPIIAPSLPPMIELIGDSKAGMLVKTGSVVDIPYQKRWIYEMHDYSIDEYVDAVLTIMFKPKLYDEMSKAALQLSKKYDMYKTYKTFIPFLR